MKIALGVIVGFIVWSVVWIGGQQIVSMMSPTWYGAKLAAAQAALAENRQPEMFEASIALINLAISILASFLAGYMAALVAGEFKRSTMVLGIILLVVGIMVEVMYWAVAPAWYHIIFILLLMPVTILGGRTRRSA